MSELARLQEENEQLVQALAAERHDSSTLRTRVSHLEELVRSLRHRQFGPSSEQSPDQISLFDDEQEEEAPEAAGTAVPVRSHARRPRGPRIAAELPRVDVIHDLDESEKVCPEHDCALTPMGEETS